MEPKPIVGDPYQKNQQKEQINRQQGSIQGGINQANGMLEEGEYDNEPEAESMVIQTEDSEMLQESSSVIIRRIWMYNISMDSMGSAIAKRTINRFIYRQRPITTTLYKCKLQSLSVYNYTYATHLVNMINMQFPFTMVQIVPLEDITEKVESYQVVYRFDVYDPDCLIQAKDVTQDQINGDMEMLGINEASEGSSIGLTKIEKETPLLQLLQSQYEGFNFDEFVQQYKKTQNQDKKNPLETIKQSTGKYKANLNKQQCKFELKLQDNDAKEHELISIFEVNLILNMFIRSYHLSHSIQFYAKKFRQMMNETLQKYPNAIYQ